MEAELGRGDRGQVGGQGQFAGEVGADLVAVGLQAGDLAAPEVAGAGAGGALPVEGDRAGREGDEDRPGEVLGGGHGRARLEPDGVALGAAAVEVQADEPGDVVRAGVTGDVGGGALLDDPAVLDDDQPVGQHHGVQRVVCDQHGDGLERRQVAAELGAHLQPGAGVQRGERLVQEQQPGPGGQGAGECDPLGLAAGQAARLGAGVCGQAHALQQLGGPGAGLRLAGAPAARPEGDVVQGAQVGEEQVVLEDHADRARLGRRAVQGGAVETQMAVGEGDETGERPQGGGLPGAVGAEQGHDVAGVGGQRDVEPEGAAVDHEMGVEALVAYRSGGGAGGGVAGNGHAGSPTLVLVVVAVPVAAVVVAVTGVAVVAVVVISSAVLRRRRPHRHLRRPSRSSVSSRGCRRALCATPVQGALIHRSRNPASTAMETASRTRLRAIAAAGSFWRAR